MRQTKEYNIYTDASFDEQRGIATYSIVVKLDNKVLKAYSKKSKIEIKTSTEIEIFAVYQAMILILSCYIKKNEKQSFCINTDCKQVPTFFKSDKATRMFKHNKSIKEDMRKTYKIICGKLNKDNFKLEYIPRDLNKIAHNQTYNMFKRIRKVQEGNVSTEDILINKNVFCEVLSNFDKRQISIIIYLLNVSKENGLIEMTQKEIANKLKLPITTMNRTIKQLDKLKILEKVRNGKYLLFL